MPKKISLAAYFFQLRNVKSHTNLDLRTFNINNKNIFTLFSEYITARNTNSSDDKIDQKILRVKHFDNTTVPNAISGSIETGEYGYTADFFDVEAQVVSEFKRKLTDAEMIPFYFLVSLPKDKPSGIIILQKFQSFGIKTVLYNDLQEFFRKLNDDLRVSLNPAFYESVIDDYRKSEIKSIRIIKYVMPKDIGDVYNAKNLSPTESYLELAIRAKKKKSISLYKDDVLAYLRQYITEKPIPLNRLIEIPQMPDYDTIKIDLEINGNTKVLNLANPFATAPLYNITDDVKTENGHPLYTSINPIAQEYLEKIESDRSIG